MADTERLSLRLKKKLISLVGEKPVVSVLLNGEKVDGLWDTGAQVSVINKKLVQELFPGIKIHAVEDFIKNDQKLKILSANQSEMAIDGVVVLDFGIENDTSLFQVPFLVTSDTLACPIIGYNAIEHFVLNYADKVEMSAALASVLNGVKLMNKEKAARVASIITEGGENVEISRAARLSKTYTIPAKTSLKVRCKVKDFDFSNSFNKPVTFAPYEELCLENDFVFFETQLWLRI